MVRAAKEDDLFELASQAGKEDPSEKGLSLQPIFLGPESGRVNDEGFETRVKTPDKSTSQTSPRKTEGVAEKKAVGRPRGTASDRSIAEVQDAIQQKFDEAFAVVSLGLPVTGTYGVENSEKAVKALISIAKRRPKLLKALLKVADGADGIEIGRYMLGIGVALQVDMGRMQPDALPARVTGVTEVVQKYFIEPEEGEVNPNVTEQTTHARFQPIS
jgi:hypothetical protein